VFAIFLKNFRKNNKFMKYGECLRRIGAKFQRVNIVRLSVRYYTELMNALMSEGALAALSLICVGPDL
jgi:hypothetical protein